MSETGFKHGYPNHENISVVLSDKIIHTQKKAREQFFVLALVYWTSNVVKGVSFVRCYKLDATKPIEDLK
jgi:hypothetical protein